MSYYEIKCKQGHCGPKKYNILTFVFEAKDILTAEKKARSVPSVKHTNRHCIISSKLISYEEYKEKRKVSAYHRKD